MTRYTAVVVYILTIVVANWMTAHYGLVPVGFGLVVSAGTFAAGFALISRDGVQVALGRRVVLVCIVAGALVSGLTSGVALAVASGIAFLVSEMVDFGVFTPLRPRSLPTAVLASSVVSAPVDTVLFLSLAGFGLSWQAVLGQFLVKTALAALVAAFIYWRHQCASTSVAPSMDVPTKRQVAGARRSRTS